MRYLTHFVSMNILRPKLVNKIRSYKALVYFNLFSNKEFKIELNLELASKRILTIDFRLELLFLFDLDLSI